MKLGKNWKRQADDLLSVFAEAMRERGLVPYEDIYEYHIRQVKEMVETIGIEQARSVITYAVKNWEALRDEASKSSPLAVDPNFHQMIVKWRYGKWLNILTMKKSEQEQKTGPKWKER